MAGIYIHIPFCHRKCIYCDFFSIGARNAPWHDFVSALLEELQLRIGEMAGAPVETLYIGGGTPSLLPPPELTRLCEALHRVAPDCREFTIEVNPEGVSREYVDHLAGCGINRVSMGVQSFNDAELRAIGRRHTAAEAVSAYRLLRPIGNVSIDLIYGLPGQTAGSWRESVRQALELRPEHISAYSLMWEEGTALSIMRRQGRVAEPPEEGTVEMYELLRRELAKAGYVHYEISNYSLPGCESRHNSSYWEGTPYLGLGPGAHSYDGHRSRRANPRDVNGYINHFRKAPPHLHQEYLLKELTPFYQEEHLSLNELREEYIMTRLRTPAGVPLSGFAGRFGLPALATLLEKASPHIAAGHLCRETDALHLTPEAVMLLDPVTLSLF